MNKSFLKLILLGLIIILGNSFFIPLAKAEDELILGVTQKCNIQYAGNNCVAKLKLTNNTGKVLDGEASLHIDYNNINHINENICKGGPFDGEGITAQYSQYPTGDDNWLDFSNNWNNGTTTVSGFEIAKDETHPRLKIETVPNLCPGKYTFTLTLKGTTETGEEYTTPPAVIGGGGGYIAPTTPITDTGEVTATPRGGGITTFTNPDGSQIKLIVPAGAVSENVRFVILPVDIGLVTKPNPDSGYFLINGLIFEVQAWLSGKQITTFNKYLTLIFTYTDEQIKELDEASLKIYWWNKNKNQWVVSENSVGDANNNTVTTSINHLTLFALMGYKTGFNKKEEKKPAGETTPPANAGIPKIVKGASTKITEGIKKIVKRITSLAPNKEKKKPLVSEKKTVSRQKSASSATEKSQKSPASMLAAMGATLKEISKSALLTIVVILCLIGLALISIKEWRLFQKKRKNNRLR